MLGTLVTLWLCAAPASDYALLPVKTIGLPAERGALYAEHLAARLVEDGLAVTTPADVAAVLGIEGQRQLLGCADGSSCLVEVAGALGAKALISGQVSRVDDGYHLVLKVLDASNAKVRFARTLQLASESALFTALDGLAAELAGRPATVSRSWWPLLPMGLGVAAAGVGAGFLVSAGNAYAALGQRGEAALSYADAVAARDSGSTGQLLGGVLVGAGALALAAGLTWFLLTAPGDAQATWLVPTPNGVALVGVWP